MVTPHQRTSKGKKTRTQVCPSACNKLTGGQNMFISRDDSVAFHFLLFYHYISPTEKDNGLFAERKMKSNTQKAIFDLLSLLSYCIGFF